MKVNILLNSTATRSGWLNIDPYAPLEDPNRSNAQVDGLDVFVDDGEVEELVALDVIDAVSSSDKIRLLNHWIAKLAHGGSLTISGLDLYQAARAIHLRQVDLLTANKLLYGENVPTTGAIPCEQMVKILSSSGLRVEDVKIINMKYVIKAVRP